MEFIKKPSLPKSRILYAAVGECYFPVIDSLKSLNIRVLTVPQYNELPIPEQFHADISLLHLGRNFFAVPENSEKLILKLKNMGAEVIPVQKLGTEYPHNTRLNFLLVGNIVIGNTKYMDNNLKQYFYNNNIKPVHVNQGYARCSTAVINENSFITSDKGISTILSKIGYSVLEIMPGYIDMPGYNYGFIGGCTGLIDKNLLAFTGDIKKHPNYLEINDFLKSNNTEYICLSSQKLIDIGGIIPII